MQNMWKKMVLSDDLLVSEQSNAHHSKHNLKHGGGCIMLRNYLLIRADGIAALIQKEDL